MFDRLVARAEQIVRELQGRRPRMAAPEHRRILHSKWMSITEHKQHPSLQSLLVPSEEQPGWADGRVEEIEAKKLQESVAGRDADAAASAPAAKAPRISAEAILGSASKGDDPDEISADDM